MRTGSNHEYKEARQAVRQAWFYSMTQEDRNNREVRQNFIKLAAYKHAVTAQTIKKWIKG